MTWHSSKMTHRETESYQCSATLLLSLHSPFLPIHLSPDPTRPDQLDPAIRSSNPVSSGKDKTVLIGGSGPRPQSPKIQLHIYATGSKSEIFTAASIDQYFTISFSCKPINKLVERQVMIPSVGNFRYCSALQAQALFRITRLQIMKIFSI